MNTLRLLGVVLMTVLFAAFVIGAVPPLTVTNPDTAPFLDGDYHVIQPMSASWYRLNYAGDHSQFSIQLDNGNKNGLLFMVHKPAQMDKWWENPSPVGRGTPAGDDLKWAGNSHEGGTWYVELQNYTNKPVVYRFETIGKGLLPEKPAVTTAPAIVPAAVPQTTFANTEPAKALPITDKEFVIPANTTLWYSFSYPGDHSQVTVNLPRGVDEHLRYDVITPEQLGSWWNAEPIGRGSPEQGALLWSSNSHVPGTYYVKVSNDNPYAVAFYLNVK